MLSLTAWCVQGSHSDALGFAPYGKNNAAKYQRRADWEQAAIDRIRKWVLPRSVPAVTRRFTAAEGFCYIRLGRLRGKFRKSGREICYNIGTFHNN
jgi:hypothetical protein